MRTVLGDTRGSNMPGWFTGITYKEPERFDPSEARLRTLNTTLDKVRTERSRLEAERVRLSPANKFHLNRLKEFEAKFGDELEARRRRVEDLRKRNLSLKSPAYTSAISRFFKLQQQRSALMQRAAAERRANQFQKAFVDRRFFQFGQRAARTVFGTEAWSSYRVDEVTRRLFKNPAMVIPCIQRVVRREVMFAKHHAGKAHRGRRRRGVFSHIGC